MPFHRTVGVDVVVDSTAAERGFSRTAGAAKKFDKELSASARGVAAASGAFQHLGRSIAFASAGFLGFAAATDVVKESITAAQDSAKAQRSLAQQLKVSGASFRDWRSQVEESSVGLEKLGFNSTQAEQALTVLDRATGNIAVALKLQTVAADIARAKNIDLSQAALIVGKAYDGQLTSLKRLGIAIPKGTSAMEALTIAGKRFAGQAAANTTEMDRFHATLHNTEIIIGNALLPVLNKLLTRFSDWLDRLNRSGKLQRDLNEAIRTGAAILEALKAVLIPIVGAFQALAHAVGGTKNAMKLLFTAFVAFKVANFASQFTSIATEADRAAFKVGLLRTAVGALAATDVILGQKALTQQATAGDVSGSNGSPFVKGSEQNSLFQAGFAGRSGVISVGPGATVDLNHLNAEGRQAYAAGLVAGIKSKATSAARGISRAASRPAAGSGAATPFPGRGIPNVNGSSSTSRLKIPGSASGSIGRGPSFKIPGTIAGTASGFRQPLAGLVPHGAFQLAAAHFNIPIQSQLQQSQLQATGNTAGLNALIARERQSAFAAIKSGRLSIQAQIEAWDFITQANNQLSQSLSSFGPTGKVASSQALTSGIAFKSVAARREQEARIAQALSHGGSIPSSQSVQGITIPIHIDGKKVAEVVTSHQNKSTRHRAVQTSGIHAGRQIP